MWHRAFGDFSTQTLRWAFPALICLAPIHADTGRADVNTLASGSALPQRKLNPNPKQACEIRFTLAGLFDLSMLAGDKAPFAVFVSFLQTRKVFTDDAQPGKAPRSRLFHQTCRAGDAGTTASGVGPLMFSRNLSTIDLLRDRCGYPPHRSLGSPD